MRWRRHFIGSAQWPVSCLIPSISEHEQASPVQNLNKIQASRMYEARGEELKSDTGIILWLCLVGIKCGNYSDHGNFLECAFQCQASDDQKLNGRIAQHEKSSSKISTFPRLSSFCGQDLHECRTKYVEAVQQMKCQKLNLNQNLQNVKIWKDLQPVVQS